MDIVIKDGKFAIEGELETPRPSKSGKTHIVASTSGFTSVQGEDGKTYSVSLNITTPKK